MYDTIGIHEQTASGLVYHYPTSTSVVYKLTPCPNQDYMHNGYAYSIVLGGKEYALMKNVSTNHYVMRLSFLCMGGIDIVGDKITAVDMEGTHSCQILETYTIESFQPILQDLIQQYRRESTARELIQQYRRESTARELMV